ncbi:HEPN domain-containing protein [Escherichia coli]|uniref:HEPN domain-containing protein n=1 Tax=Escherichia coli TaxID=562 RepID=UPI000DA44AEB|nr:HEPN domain-containing protein [Escherichia coli]SQJ95733.1 Uncharacterised protein [Escherichia coli]SQN74712.1 Uncharacterised protein [Escherichia coli]SQQ67868.1 Uncharacterised protein [Escherichia coli]HCO5676375.1 hypothetical protein [Escherichia coli]
MEDMGYTSIESMFNNYKCYYDFLLTHNEISFANDYKSQFSKVMLLACASYFETLVVTKIHCMLNPSQCNLTHDFIDNKALTRQYHTLFDWKKRNANQFFSFFGPKFKEFMIEKVKSSTELTKSISDFMEIGELRNKLAHNNYATFVLESTAEEIYNNFLNAHSFVSQLDTFSTQFREQIGEQ